MGRNQIEKETLSTPGVRPWVACAALLVAVMTGSLAMDRGVGIASPSEPAHAPAPPDASPPSPPQGETDDGGRPPETLPGRDDPDEFYKKPPRLPKKLVRLPA